MDRIKSSVYSWWERYRFAETDADREAIFVDYLAEKLSKASAEIDVNEWKRERGAFKKLIQRSEKRMREKHGKNIVHAVASRKMWSDPALRQAAREKTLARYESARGSKKAPEKKDQALAKLQLAVFEAESRQRLLDRVDEIVRKENKRRPVLLGEVNPYSNDPREAFAPWPKKSAGYRLWEMTELPKRDYLIAFDRRNVSDVGSLRFKPHQMVVVFGDEARRCVETSQGIKLKKAHFVTQTHNDVPYTLLPHPSGKCRFYNDKDKRAAVGAFLRSLL